MGSLFRFELPFLSEKERVKSGDEAEAAFSLRPPASSHLFTLNSSLYSLFIVFHDRHQLFQKALLAEGIELEEHGRTAT